MVLICNYILYYIFYQNIQICLKCLKSIVLTCWRTRWNKNKITKLTASAKGHFLCDTLYKIYFHFCFSHHIIWWFGVVLGAYKIIIYFDYKYNYSLKIWKYEVVQTLMQANKFNIFEEANTMIDHQHLNPCCSWVFFTE